MATRHLARSIVLQSLYEWEFYHKTHELKEIVLRNMNEFSPDIDEPDFLWRIANGVVEHMPELDAIIEKAAPEWPLAQIAMVDRNILRVGLYEILFGDSKQVPAKVAINEAIELAKTFGAEHGHKYVNAILDKVAASLRASEIKASHSAA